MTNSSASPAVKRGSILRLQLASLLRPHISPRIPRFDSAPSSPVDSFPSALRRCLRPKPVPRGQAPVTNGRKSSSLSHPRAPLSSFTLPVVAWVNQQSSVTLGCLSATAVLLIGWIDDATGPEMSFAIFYLLPVIFATWFAGQRVGLLVSALAALVGLLADLSSSVALAKLAVPLWNESARLCIFILAVLMLSRIRVLQNGLEETVRRRTQQLEAETARGLAMEREVAAVSTREQQRIAHELHDGLGQELGGLAFQAKLLAAKLADGGMHQSQEAERLVSLLNQSIARTRSLSNLLDPVGSESGGLRVALSNLVERSGRVFGLACTFASPELLPTLSREAELDLYRIAQEAIHNAVQHGHASEVHVHLTVSHHSMVLAIRDNGRGFVTNGSKHATPKPADRLNTNNSAHHTSGQHLDRGMGLRIMRYRAAGLNARLDISSESGRGSKVICTMPLG